MKLQAPLALIAIVAATCLAACNKQPDTESTATTAAPGATASDSAADTAGTTTYYGSSEEQAQTPKE